MSGYVIVTDSTVNLPEELQSELQIPTIPLNVHWGEDTYLDGVTLKADAFYKMLTERKDFPKTSQPSAGAFIEFFTEVAKEYQVDTILGIFISAELSGTMASATQARAELSDLNIELMDSRSVSMGLGLQVLAAFRAAEQGKSLQETMDIVKRCQEQSHVIFVVDTLEYLHRGGRIGGAARLLGSALNLKPVLMIDEGRVESLEKVRSRKKSLTRLIELVKERTEGQSPTEVGIIHAAADDTAKKVMEQVKAELKPDRIHIVTLTPVVGTHGGPGTVGIAFTMA
jgi:DegV family protein with EDD domain